MAGMSVQQSFLGSTIGKKIVMAATGVMLFGFVVMHMIGNLNLYLGSEAMNGCSEFLHELMHGGGLWVARAGLLGAVVLHVWAAVSLTERGMSARPVGYREWQARESTYASRSMRWTGLFLAGFIVYHILDLTIGVLNPGFEHGNVHRNVVASFTLVPVALFYIGAMLLLGLHLKHGTMSMLRTLGMSHPRHEAMASRALGLIAAGVVVANISFPLAVMFGVVR